MPNPQNINSPLILLGFGRSGTSLIHRLFELHSHFEAVGETSEMIFGTWYAAELSLELIRWHENPDGTEPRERERCGQAVRGAMMTILPSKKKRWMQKPIGLPGLRPYFTADKLKPTGDFIGDFPAAWYWRALRNSFPEARYFTALRQPCDVVLSSVQYWGWTEAEIWRRYSEHARLMLHGLSGIEYGVCYEDLIRDPEAQVRAFFQHFKIPWQQGVMKAFGELHVPAKGREEINPAKTSRRKDWHKLAADAVTPEIIADISKLWKKFGLSFDLPPQLEHLALATA